LKYHKLFESEKKKNNHKRSLSFGSINDDNTSINKKLIDDNINEVEIKEKNKEDTSDNEINTSSNKEINKYEINIEENLNIEDNIIKNNLIKNMINDEEEENNNLISNNQKIILSDDNDSSSEVSDEDPKNPIIRGINIKTIFGEKLEDQKERLQLNSPFKNFKTFNIFKAIIKAGEDLKQEQFATQLIQVFREIFNQNNVDCWLSSYEVISTGQDCGLVEMVCNSLSMDQIKRKTGLSLKQFYLEYFGNEKKKKYQQAIKNFIRSLAGYSLVCYFLQIKDRHNGNILIDSKGHLIHIDFGFMLSNAPGKGIKFEKAPFKITDEMLELLGGINSENFKEYRKRLIKGYFAIFDNFEKIQKLVEFMFMGQGKYFPCFAEKENALKNLKDRLRPNDNMGKQQKIQYIDDLLSKSIDNWTTNYYDKFQYYIQGIFY
jgi:phosphatidylinositol 4-kinase